MHPQQIRWQMSGKPSPGTAPPDMDDPLSAALSGNAEMIHTSMRLSQMHYRFDNLWI